MNSRSRLIIAATLVVIGAGVIGLGYLEDESSVRYVQDLHSKPEAHSDGSFTLLGIPQPVLLPDGSYNTEYAGSIVRFERWSQDGTEYVTKFTSTVDEVEPALFRFTVTKETTTAGSQELAFPAEEEAWDLAGDYQVFQVDDFETPFKVWAAFSGALNGDIQPKPSQLQGALADAPDGLLVWLIEPDGYTVGCSSKFLPDEVKSKYDKDGDGRTD